MYTVVFTEDALAALNRQPAKRRARIAAILNARAADPFARHPRLERLKGAKDRFRYRLGDWRVLYRLDRKAKVLRVVDIRPRGRAYE